jgi:molecular chaperone GrpE
MNAKSHKETADPAVDTPAPEPAAAPAGAAPAADESKTIAQLEDRLLRLQADFDNFRKRTAREQAEASQRAHENLMIDLLPVLDHFELGLANAREHHADSAVMGGFELIHDQLTGLLQRYRLTPLDAAAGDPFDPHRHEAAVHMPTAVHPEDTVISQIRRGYKLGEKLLRPAQVVVASAAEPPPVDVE